MLYMGLRMMFIGHVMLQINLLKISMIMVLKLLLDFISAVRILLKNGAVDMLYMAMLV